MKAEKVIYSLLASDVGVTALVGASIHAQQMQQGAALPAIVYSHIDSQELDPISAAAFEESQVLTRARIQVNALAADTATRSAYDLVKDILENARLACSFKSGVIAGVQVVSVLRDSSGPDLRDDDLGVVTQSADFIVTFYQ